MIKTSIIIPAYCEEKGLAVVLPKIFKVINDSYEIIIVDDGSNDGTVNVAMQYPCRIIKHNVNKGKGHAIRTGISKAWGENIIWIDADDSYPTEIIPLINNALEFYELVVCSRAYGKKHIPKFNRLGVWLFKTLIRNIYNFKGYDPCTGLYGAKKSCLEQMKLTSTRFAIEPEISIKSGRMKLRTLDMSIEYKKRVGFSKLNTFKTGFDDLTTIAKFIFWKNGNG